MVNDFGPKWKGVIPPWACVANLIFIPIILSTCPSSLMFFPSGQWHHKHSKSIRISQSLQVSDCSRSALGIKWHLGAHFGAEFPWLIYCNNCRANSKFGWLPYVWIKVWSWPKLAVCFGREDRALKNLKLLKINWQFVAFWTTARKKNPQGQSVIRPTLKTPITNQTNPIFRFLGCPAVITEKNSLNGQPGNLTYRPIT